MKRLKINAVIAALLFVPTVACAEQVQATLSGYKEVPAVSTPAGGQFRAMISPGEQTIDYVLAYRGLSGPATQAHIHFAQAGVNGDIVVWLCGSEVLPGPTGTPSCPGTGGTVSGTITPASVIGPGGPQQIDGGELDEVIAAIRASAAYANVHTAVSPGGEIRGQIRAASQP